MIDLLTWRGTHIMLACISQSCLMRGQITVGVHWFSNSCGDNTTNKRRLRFEANCKSPFAVT